MGNLRQKITDTGEKGVVNIQPHGQREGVYFRFHKWRRLKGAFEEVFNAPPSPPPPALLPLPHPKNRPVLCWGRRIGNVVFRREHACIRVGVSGANWFYSLFSLVHCWCLDWCATVLYLKLYWNVQRMSSTLNEFMPSCSLLIFACIWRELGVIHHSNFDLQVHKMPLLLTILLKHPSIQYLYLPPNFSSFLVLFLGSYFSKVSKCCADV